MGTPISMTRTAPTGLGSAWSTRSPERSHLLGRVPQGYWRTRLTLPHDPGDPNPAPPTRRVSRTVPGGASRETGVVRTRCRGYGPTGRTRVQGDSDEPVEFPVPGHTTRGPGRRTSDPTPRVAEARVRPMSVASYGGCVVTPSVTSSRSPARS